MPATIFSGNNVKALKSNLDLNGVTSILSVNADPASGAGVAAPLGSIAMDYLAGKVYKKTGSLATEWQELGSGIGGINYIENPDAESGTSGWSTYADAAGSAPVDGTGGTANITWNRRVPTPPLKPLRGVADFSLVKDAVNRQGQGVSYDFTIDSADQAKILTISADYEVLSGTFATGDLAVYIIQDPAGTPVVLQPAGYQVTAATVGNKVRLAATFQTASNVTSYRLCIHVASVSASAYTLAFDSIAVSPQQVVYGAPVTDWQSFTPTGTWTTNTTYTGRWRRVGDSMQMTVTAALTGAPNAVALRFNLPSGFSIDTSKLANTDTTSGSRQILGSLTVLDAGLSVRTGSVVFDTSTTLWPYSADATGDFSVSSTNPITFGNGDAVSIVATFPILGWSSSVVVSSSTDTRVVAMQTTGTASATLTSSLSLVKFSATSQDTHGAYSPSTGLYTVPVAGFYRCTVASIINGSAAASLNSAATTVYRNGASTFVSQSGFYIASQTTMLLVATGTLFCNAGDTLAPYASTQVGSPTISSSSYFNVERLSGPSQIAASETVAARYAKNGNQAIGSGGVKLTSWTRDYDSHGIFDSLTNRIVVPVAGKYRLEMLTSVTSGANGNILSTGYIKNGGALIFTGGAMGYTDGTSKTYGGDTINMNAGDYLEIYFYGSAGVTVSGSTTYFTITKVG